MKVAGQVFVLMLLVGISFFAGAFIAYSPGIPWIDEVLHPPAASVPALASVELEGNVEIDLSSTGSRAEALKTLFLSQNPKALETFEKLARQQAATTHYQTIYREAAAMPLPLDIMELRMGKSLFDSKGNRIVVPYTMAGYIVAPDESLFESLSFDEITSEYTEVLTVPADPTNLFQRLGYACANQEDIPLGQVDDTNYGSYFDPTCGPGVKTCKSPDNKPLKPCLDVLQKENGVGTVTVHFTYVPYDPAIAEKWQKSPEKPQKGVDLTVDQNDLKKYDIVYKKFEQNSCAIQEQCIAGPGVRRLLRFNGSVSNKGDTDLVFGEVNQLQHTHQFEFNTCHMHNHFEGFAAFSLAKNEQTLLSSRKQTFCVESTDRVRNDADTSYTADYDCEYQGLKAGWKDEYFAGLDCQWIDITDLQINGEKEEFTLSMEVNPQKLLCEGQPNTEKYFQATDEKGQKILNKEGQPIRKQSCQVNKDYYKNNKTSVSVTIPKTGGSVNQPCDTLAFGPMRNCGWQMGEVATCKAGTPVSLAQTANDLTRACPHGVPCTHDEALISSETKNAKFTCPKEEKYLIMTAPYY